MPQRDWKPSITILYDTRPSSGTSRNCRPDLPRIAGTEAKWENEFKEARQFVPKDIVSNNEVMKKLTESAIGAWNALPIRDYARIDMRLRAHGTPIVIEVDPNHERTAQ